MVEIRNLSAGYGKEEILHEIHFTAKNGRINANQVLAGCENSSGPKTGIECIFSGKIGPNVATRDCLVSDIMEKIMSVAPVASILTISPVTT